VEEQGNEIWNELVWEIWNEYIVEEQGNEIWNELVWDNY
jgi:hypothetical protein